MCSIEEDISTVKFDDKNIVKLLGKPNYCNSGLVEYTITRVI
jgi:hypothetical protein